MNFLVISRGLWIRSTRRLFDVGRQRGHRVRVLDPEVCVGGVGGDGHAVSARHEPAAPYDAVLPRIGFEQLADGLAAVAAARGRGVPCLNGAAAIRTAADKLECLAVLAARGLPVPRTYAARRGDHLARRLQAELGSAAVVVKTRRGSQGAGVMLAPDAAAAGVLVESLAAAGVPALAQEFHPEAGGRDHRLLVLRGRVVAAATRSAASGDFRSNFHRGGTMEALQPEPALAELALAAAAALGLGLAGVDVLPSARGPLVLEVNAAPGFEGLEDATGLDIARAIVVALEQLAGG